MRIFNMVQKTPHLWEIQSQGGALIQGNITAHSEYEATEYIKRYVSSYSGCSYVIIILKIDNKARVIKK